MLTFLDRTQLHTPGTDPLYEWSARRGGRYLQGYRTNTKKKIHAVSRIRTRSTNSRAAADLRLKPRGYWDRLMHISVSHLVWINLTAKLITNIGGVATETEQGVEQVYAPIWQIRGLCDGGGYLRP